MIREPPQQTVYQRIVKPFPAVMLTSNYHGKYPENNLFVEATLLRSDSETEINQYLNGTHLESLSNNNIATFKKLKVLATSVKEGCMFRFKFTLKRYTRDHFEPVPNVTVISNPIEIFSHTCYITKPKGIISNLHFAYFHISSRFFAPTYHRRNYTITCKVWIASLHHWQ
jgi:hypothetical protein